MAQVTQTRDSGIEVLDTELDELHEDAEGQHFRTDEPVKIQVGETVGEPLYVEATHFVAASISGTQTVGPIQAQVKGISPEDPNVVEVDDETGEIIMETDEASIFVSNDEAEIGGGVIRVEGGEMEDAYEKFEEEHL